MPSLTKADGWSFIYSTKLYFKEGRIASFNIAIVLVQLYLKFLEIFESGNILEYNRERCSTEEKKTDYGVPKSLCEVHLLVLFWLLAS